MIRRVIRSNPAQIAALQSAIQGALAPIDYALRPGAEVPPERAKAKSRHDGLMLTDTAYRGPTGPALPRSMQP